MLKSISRFLGLKPQYRVLTEPAAHRVLFAETFPYVLRKCIEPEITHKHEGLAYLFGQTDGKTTIILGVARAEAYTTPGSFEVSAVAMARVVRKINDAGLQLIGQAHSHPGQAFHSDGDDAGARIAYQGFVSIVVPDYGQHLPAMNGWAVYFFREGHFAQLTGKDVSCVPMLLP
jgi:proteasome lid subunit RPN8/RPN11